MQLSSRPVVAKPPGRPDACRSRKADLVLSEVCERNGAIIEQLFIMYGG